MAIQTGQGIGAAQNLKGSIGNVDISGITDQILNAAQERRKISAEEKKRGLEDAVKFKKQENALTSGKTPFYSEMGKSVQKSLYDKFMNNEISAVEYEQGLTKAANELSFFEKTIQSSSGKFNGYIYDEETNKFRRGNPVNDFLSSGEGASAYAEQYMNGQYAPAHILETGTTGLNENFYEEPKGDWRKSFYKNKDELTKLAEPSFGVSEFDQNYDVASTIKQVPVLDVVKLVFSDDDAMQSLEFDLIAKEGKTKQEAKAITSDIEETKKYITQKLGLEDQYFKEQISKLNKKSKTGGGLVEGEDYTIDEGEDKYVIEGTVRTNKEGGSQNIKEQGGDFKRVTFKKDITIPKKAKDGNVVEVKLQSVKKKGDKIYGTILMPNPKQNSNDVASFSESEVELDDTQKNKLKASGFDFGILENLKEMDKYRPESAKEKEQGETKTAPKVATEEDLNNLPD